MHLSMNKSYHTDQSQLIRRYSWMYVCVCVFSREYTFQIRHYNSCSHCRKFHDGTVDLLFSMKVFDLGHQLDRRRVRLNRSQFLSPLC